MVVLTEKMIKLFEKIAKEMAKYLVTSYNQEEADAAKEYFWWALKR